MTDFTTCSMAEAAKFAGLSYDRFKRTWRALRKTEGFPPPLRGGDGVNYVWRLCDLTTWQDLRIATLATLRPEPSPIPPPEVNTRAARANGRLMARMSNAR